MRLLILFGGIVVLGAVLWLMFSSPTQPVPEVKNDTIVWLGDSIGAGYGATPGNSPPEYLAQKLNVPVINESTDGDMTADGVAKIPHVLEHDPGLVIIQLGGNDALRKLPTTEIEANVRKMIVAFQAEGIAVAIIGIRSGILGDQYDVMFEDLASEYELVYIPDALQGLFGRSEYMADPIHPNDAGSEVLAARVFEAIRPIYE